MFFELIRGLLLTDGRCFWQVNSGSGVDGSQKLRFHGEAAGCARMSNLHLLKSGIAVLTQDPKLKFTQKNRKRGGQKKERRKFHSALFSTCHVWGSHQGRTEWSRRKKKKNTCVYICVPSFPVFFMTKACTVWAMCPRKQNSNIRKKQNCNITDWGWTTSW